MGAQRLRSNRASRSATYIGCWLETLHAKEVGGSVLQVGLPLVKAKA